MQKLLVLLSSLVSLLITPVYANSFSLGSTSFTNLSQLNATYTCDGSDISPELEWKNSPAKTKSFAFILADPDAPSGTFYHWIVFNIPKNVTSFAEGMIKLPAGIQVGKNSLGGIRYNGPCPPKGATHHYIFSLYALNTTLDLASGTDATSIIHAMQNHILGVAELKAVYEH